MSDIFQVRTDDRQVRRALRRLGRAGKHLGPVAKALKKPFRNDLRSFSKQRRSPDGAWRARAQSSEEARKRENRTRRRAVPVKYSRTSRKFKKQNKKRPNKILGKVPSAVHIKPSRNGVQAKSKIGWSGIHNEGGFAGNGAYIPERPHIYVSPKLLSLAAAELVDYAAKVWKK